MATAVVMPKQGNSVEAVIIVEWKKKKGDPVSAGETLLEVETDKAVMEVESPASGTLLAVFFNADDEVPVMTNIAVIGQPGEETGDFRPGVATAGGEAAASTPAAPTPAETPQPSPAPTAAVGQTDGPLIISPRARNLAQRKALDPSALQGSGPGGRIIERDVAAALQARPKLTPLAKSMLAEGGYQAPASGSGVGGRVTAKDLQPVAPVAGPAPAPTPTMAPSPEADEVTTIPVRGVRKVIAARMLESLQTTAQLTLNSSADARAILAYRQRLKASAEALGLQAVTINDLILFAVSRTLPQYPELNALFQDETISQYKSVHLGFAVDTPRGLIVPVIRRADGLSLKAIAAESRRLAEACLAGKVSPDELSGGTFTVTNLGSLGVESFTPVLNPPQVGILGVGNVNLKPVGTEDAVRFAPHLGLSLTINHQVVDGAPAARFLQALSQGLADLELLLAL